MDIQKTMSKVEVELLLAPRYIYTNPDSGTFSPPTEFENLPESWQTEILAQEPTWSRVCAEEALYQAGNPVQLVSFEVTRDERIKLVIRTDSNLFDEVPKEVAELYADEGGGGSQAYLAEIFHALEQRIDTGIDGWQWAYGVNQRAPIQHPTSDSSCVMVFSIKSCSVWKRD